MKTKNNTLSTFIRYLIPSILGMVLVAIYTFTDTFVIGRELGSIALGAMGICTPVITISYSLGFLWGMGGGTLYSINIGKKDEKEANKIFTTSLVMVLLIGACMAIFGNIIIEQFAYTLGADEANIKYVLQYLRCIIIYIPGFMYDVFIMTYMKNAGQPNVAMTATIVGTSLNVVLDCLFVFVFKWGMFGAAFATCIGSLLCSMINTGYIIVRKFNLIPKLKNIKIEYIARIFKTGFSVFILECSAGVVTFVFIKQATRLYGTIGSSVYTVIMNWSLICFNLIMGVSQAVQPLISISYGEGNKERVHKYRKYAIITSTAFGVLFLVIGYSMTESLISIFAKDNIELVAITTYCFRLYLPAYLIMCIGISLGIYFQSIEESLKSLVIMLARGIVLPVIVAFILPAIFNNRDGLWLAVPCAELITSVIAVILVIKADKGWDNLYIKQTNQVNSYSKPKEHFVITISREFGSGGRNIGQIIGEALNIPVYDKQVSELTAVQSKFHSDIISEEEDKKIFPVGLYTNGHYTPISYKIFTEQCKIIRRIADEGSCVIIGRCADYALKDNYNTFNVFVHAPIEMRIERVMEYDRCTKKEAIEKINESDDARLKYHEFFTDVKWGKSQNYDLTINSELGLDNVAKIIISSVRMSSYTLNN